MSLSVALVYRRVTVRKIEMKTTVIVTVVTVNVAVSVFHKHFLIHVTVMVGTVVVMVTVTVGVYNARLSSSRTSSRTSSSIRGSPFGRGFPAFDVVWLSAFLGASNECVLQSCMAGRVSNDVISAACSLTIKRSERVSLVKLLLIFVFTVFMALKPRSQSAVTKLAKH